MPRLSPEARAASAIMSKRPTPPAGLSPAAREHWQAIVSARAPAFFDSGSAPLLAQFCRVLVQHARVMAAVEAIDPAVMPAKYGQAVRTMAKVNAVVVTLATKLRLTVQSGVHRRAGILDETSKVASLLGGNVDFRLRKPQ